jgi:hypothetical protein
MLANLNTMGQADAASEYESVGVQMSQRGMSRAASARRTEFGLLLAIPKKSVERLGIPGGEYYTQIW